MKKEKEIDKKKCIIKQNFVKFYKTAFISLHSAYRLMLQRLIFSYKCILEYIILTEKFTVSVYVNIRQSYGVLNNPTP